MRDQLINKINVLHFQDDQLVILFRHKKHEHLIQINAAPLLCKNEVFRAAWIKDDNFPDNLDHYNLEKIIIPGETQSIEFKPDFVSLEEDQIEARIPDQIDPITGRKSARYLCNRKDISATIFQNSVGFEGQLLDFSPHSLRIKVTAKNPQNFFWINAAAPVILNLADDNLIFSGPMNILRHSEGENERIYILEPNGNFTPRYRPKACRTKRVTMQPSPMLQFRHPLTGSNRTMCVKDLSTLGFCVDEPVNNSTLIAGMLLPNVRLKLPGDFFIEFQGQVVYRREEDDRVYCGITILDVDLEDHYRLIGLVHQTEDERSFVSTSADPDDFFQFFFDSGFLYPSKYAEIALDRDKFVESYKKLYGQKNDVARCFVYKVDGQITGHISALRINKYTWLNHHHAALGSDSAGLRVLRQLSDFINDSYALDPVQMRYVAGIYRPENRSPNRFFGGFAKKVNDPKKTSTDLFAYYKNSEDACERWGEEAAGPWQIERANSGDMVDFCGFYDKVSGGLLAKAFDLTPDSFDDSSLSEAYKKSGLKRFRHLYAIRKDGDLKALVDVQDSDTGLNMSELTNTINFYVLDQEEFTPDTFEMVRCVVAVKHNKCSHPVLLFPTSYVEKYNLVPDKYYEVWLLNLDYSDLYMENLLRYTK